MPVRNYSSVADETTLVSGINNSATVIIVASTVGFPVSTPYTLALDYGAATEELVDVTGVAGPSLTVTRAVDSTSAAAHGAGAKVRHVSSARDFREANDHINASSGVHGVVGPVVGTTDTQTLTNKTLTSPILNSGVLNGTYSGNPAFSGNPRTNPGAFFDHLGSGAGSSVAGARVNADPFDRWLLLASGQQEWGPGSGATDVVLSRTGVGALGVTGSFDSTTTDLASGVLLTASAGWSISALTVGELKGGWLCLNGTITRTGANITIDAAGAPSGGIMGMATISNPYRPKANLGVMYLHAGNSIATGTIRINTASTGLIELVRWQASQTITTGNAISFTATYPIT